VIEYKRRKHATWALVFMVAACASDFGDDVKDEESEHAHDFQQDNEPGRVHNVKAESQDNQQIVTINGVRVERGVAKPGDLPKDGPCSLKFGDSTPKDARDLFGEPSWTNLVGSTELLSFYYETEALLVVEFVEGRLNNLFYNSANGIKPTCRPSGHG
jgi:hypothetical protein